MTTKFHGLAVINVGTSNDPKTILRRVEGDSIWDLARQLGIDYIERVHGRHSRDRGFVAGVDEDGWSKGFNLNMVAAELIGYPGKIVGPCLLISEGWVDDGMDFMSLSDKGAAYIKEKFGLLPTDDIELLVGKSLPGQMPLVEKLQHPVPKLEVITFEGDAKATRDFHTNLQAVNAHEAEKKND